MALHAAKRRRLSGQDAGKSLSDDGAEINTNAESDRDEDDNQTELSSENEEQTEQRPSRSTGHIRGRSKLSIGKALSMGSHRSELSQLQVDELLVDVRQIQNKKRDRIDALLRMLKEIIEQIPEQKELSVCFP